jgi:hypothetical protein
MRNLNRDIEPFSRFGPSDIELIFRRLNNVIKTIVNRVVELRIRNVDSLLYTKFVLVASVRRIESATADVASIAGGPRRRRNQGPYATDA